MAETFGVHAGGSRPTGKNLPSPVVDPTGATASLKWSAATCLGMSWASTRSAVERRTERVLSDLDDRWGDHERRSELVYHSPPHDRDEPPSTAAAQLATMAGIASVVVWNDRRRREVVLVYNPSGGWEPPGGRIEPGQTPEAAARAEAREETGLAVELTELLYTRRVAYTYDDGRAVDLPVAQFAGYRTDGRLHVEREGRTHPGVSRATGLFDAETLPETRRDHDLIAERLGDPPARESCPGPGWD